MKLIQHMINQKAQAITGKELLKYAKQLNIPLSEDEAEKVAACVRKRRVDLFNEKERAQLLREIAKATSPQTARQINRVFSMFVN
ncbi:hypothetical protein JOC78_003006 [Bacillus ectoiniformans]|uniref:DUF2624 domain-containing protein n=1 Tax=Bacillus ectoiniformans TaxID=1494429 RepID=UPI0019573FC3|nr:DUF2624 domain-containing protein [Bacillus ectoiniformans]MBM7650022.1 hypothetical protein [Bacillus ectoiniformans]